MSTTQGNANTNEYGRTSRGDGNDSDDQGFLSLVEDAVGFFSS